MSHAVVWIDHSEARIFDVRPDAVSQSIVDSPRHHIHRHPKDQETKIRNHPDDEHRFFRDVARLLGDAAQVLVVGPSQTKLHFFKYVQEHERGLEPRIVGIETADHPTDAQLVAYLRHYFHESAPRRGALR
jgi:stalled ribosome rescue protein Dom34